MPHDVNLIDRLRIERVVWSLDQRLYDLPRKTRIDRRRELRTNLMDAAHDVGHAGRAPRRRRQRHPRGRVPRRRARDPARATRGWPPACSCSRPCLLLTSVLFDAADAFGDGILAGNPDADGTFTWPGIGYLQTEVTYTVERRAPSSAAPSRR